MASGNRTLAQEMELDAGLIRKVLIFGTTLFAIWIIGVGLLL